METKIEVRKKKLLIPSTKKWKEMTIKQLRAINTACDSSSQNENVTLLFCACVCFEWLSYIFPVVVPPAGIITEAIGQFCTHMSIPGIFQTFHQSTNYHPNSVGGRLFKGHKRRKLT